MTGPTEPMSGLKSGIARKLIISILLFSLIVTCIMTSFELYMDYSDALESIDTKLEEIEKTHLQGIINGMWVTDHELLAIYLEEILYIPDIQYLAITSNNENIITAGTPAQESVVTRNYPLIYFFNDRQVFLGTLHVTASLEGIYSRLFNKGLFILINKSIEIFLVSMFLFFLFYFLIGKHLKTMADYTKALSFESLDRALVLKRSEKSQDELDQLVSSINSMREGLVKHITERKSAEKERILHVHFLENLQRVHDAILQSPELETMMQSVLDTMLSLFNSDRAWLLYPCDPDAPSWQVPMERTRPEYPGALAMGIDIPMLPEAKDAFQTALDSGDPVTYDTESGRALPPDSSEQFSIQSQIIMAIRPKTGKPWLLGMHQCSHPRIWTKADQVLFKEIGRRIMDALSSLLMFRNMKASEEKFSKAFRSSPTLMAISTLHNGRLLEVNDAFLHASGYRREEIIGHTPLEIGLWAKQADLDVLVNGLRKHGAIHNQKAGILTKSGNSLKVLYSADLIEMDGEQCTLIAALDITELKKLEEQLLHAQKMESIGTLAGGIAHDFNNILMAIIGFAGVLEKKLPANDPLKLYVNQIQRASDNAAKLTRSLLAFSRKQQINAIPADLNETIRTMEKFLIRVIGEDIEFRTALADTDLTVMIDVGQIEQVLMNLAANARDAMQRGGSLTIRTEAINIEHEFIKHHGFGEPGEYALISMTDTGSGMNEETRGKIFEPFFTTKEVDKGTGLGLSMVYGIIKQHGGYITVYSEPGLGTNFNIYLPLIKEAEDTDKTESSNSVPAGGTETILLAEDDSMIRELLTSILEESGYRIIAARDGEDGLNKFMEHSKDIQFLILDAIMPKKYGSELFEEIKKIRPAIKGIFLSGYTSEVIDRESLLKEGMDFISKPIRPNNLLNKIRELLDST